MSSSHPHDRTSSSTADPSAGWFQIRTRVDPSVFAVQRGARDDDDPNSETYGLAQMVAWQPGARVLAPWEPAFRYVGSVAAVDDERALVEFDDGGSAWVHVNELRPLDLQIDQFVMCRREQTPFYFAARIIELRGKEARVRYEDGGSEWTGPGFLRFPCEIANARVMVVTPADWQGFYEDLEPGTRVWAPWRADTLHAGTVTKVKRDKVHIAFDNGDEGWVLLMQILPLAVPTGLHVLRSSLWSADFVQGTVAEIKGARVLVRDRGGNEVWTPLAKVAVPCSPAGPDARPTRRAFRVPSAHTLWIIAGLIVVALWLLMMSSCD